MGVFNINPNYVKDETLTRLQEYIDKTNLDSIYQTLVLYLYLIGDARVLNLLVKEIGVTIPLQSPDVIPEPLTFQFLECLIPMPTEEQNRRLQSIREQIPYLLDKSEHILKDYNIAFFIKTILLILFNTYFMR